MESPFHWFAMRATYKRELVAQEYLQGKGIEVFVPMKSEIKVVRGIKRKITVPAINSLIFVYAQKQVLQDAKYGLDYLQYITRRIDGKNVPIIVPHSQMEAFIKVVQDENTVKTFHMPGEVDLALGTKVKIHGGAFDGMEGVLVRVKGKRKQQFFIELKDLVAVNTVIENVDLLEVIE